MEKTIHRRPGKWTALTACLLALFLSAGATLFRMGDYGGVIPDRVTVAGYPVGGLTAEQAEEYLKEALGESWGEQSVLLCRGDRLVLQARRKELGAQLDLSMAAKEAAALGTGGGIWKQMCRGISRLWGGPETDITPRVTIDVQTLSVTAPLEAQNAWYDEDSGQIMEGHPGLTIATDQLAATLAGQLEGVVQFQVDLVYPEIDADTLVAALFRDVLSTYTTQVGGSDVRRGNVALAASALNGTVLQPGEVFDFDQTVGERTEAAGYGMAPSFLDGEVVDTVGGGVCQVSSTLYAAALEADLTIRSRSPHRYAVSYLPAGLDAAVSWGGPVFRFENTGDYPLRIDAGVENGTLRVTLVGTKTEDTYIEMETETTEVLPYTTRYVETEELEPGEEQTVQEGIDGMVVESYRCRYRDDGTLLSRTLEAVSRYGSREKVVEVGAEP